MKFKKYDYYISGNKLFSLFNNIFKIKKSKYDNDVINNIISKWYDENYPFYIPDMYTYDDTSPIADCLCNTDLWYDMIVFPDKQSDYSDVLKSILRPDDYEFLDKVEGFMNNYFRNNKSKIYSNGKLIWKFNNWSDKDKYPDYKYRSIRLTSDGKIYIKSKDSQDYIVIPVSIIKYEIKSISEVPDKSIFYIDEPSIIASNPNKIIRSYRQIFGEDYKKDSK